MPSISHRLQIEWPPAKPFEDTDTIVLCSREFHLVDLRVYRNPKDPKEPLEWIMTGQENPISESPRVIEFQHEISTHHPNNSDGPWDRASFVSLPDGNSKETGTMINISTGKYEDYHEIWTRLDPIKSIPDKYVTKLEPNGDDVLCVVTKVKNKENYIGSVMRLGNFFQGALLNTKTRKVSANRYYFRDGKWDSLIEYGDEVSKLPLIDSGAVDKTYEKDGLEWIVVESNN